MIREIEPLAGAEGIPAAPAWELRAPDGLRVVVTALGASVVSVEVPHAGEAIDVVLGFPTAEGYATKRGFVGATVGRVANRIARGHAIVGGRAVQLSQNIPGAHLHGGVSGFSRKTFACRIVDDTLVCTHVSPDSDEGYPGELTLHVGYRLEGANTLVMTYEFSSDAATLANPTNHGYFNLAGHAAGTLDGHLVQIRADHVTGVDAEGFGSDELVDVTGTVLDLRRSRAVVDAFDAGDPALAGTAGGYDHNYVLGAADAPREVARVVHEPSGRSLTLSTTAPCLQFYTANHVNLDGGKQGATYGPRGAFCLEPQYAPNTAELPGLRSSQLAANVVGREETRYVFGW